MTVCFSLLQDSQEKNANPVKAEEAKLKAKYPGLGQKPGGSDFLMKRLQKGVGDSWKKQLCLNKIVLVVEACKFKINVA